MDGRPDAAAEIRGQYPGWTLWVSGTGRWWASRTVELTAADVAAGCVPFLHADDPQTLTRQIGAQEARRAGAAHRAGAPDPVVRRAVPDLRRCAACRHLWPGRPGLHRQFRQ